MIRTTVLRNPFRWRTLCTNLFLRYQSHTTRGQPKVENRNSQINFEHFQSHNSNEKRSKWTYKRLFLVGGTAGLTVGLLTSDSVYENTKHTILTAKRVGVVAEATFRCFRLYKNTLSKEYDTPQDRNKALAKTHKDAATITLRALERNGGIYIKLGQHITALTYLLPREWTDTMIPLQDKCPQLSMEEINSMFLLDLGVSVNDLFSEFNPEPIGVASLAQVHLARLRETGEQVAVKVQHPSLAEFVPLDVYLTTRVFELMRKVFPEYPLTWLGDELRNLIFVELNFENEAENAERTANYFKDYKQKTALRIPRIVTAHKRILVMECVSGARLDDLKYMEQHKISTAEVSSCLSHIFSDMIFTPNVGLHCDPHGGNLAIRALDHKSNGHNFEIILYDHGLYRQIPLQMKRDYSHFWLSVIDNNVEEMKKYADKIAGIRGDQRFKIFLAAITGRDPETALSNSVVSQRSHDEVTNIQRRIQEEDGVLEDLMDILSTMPRIILLILKTNDLTRALDENLNNPLGPERTFLILANYCARCVYDEQVENLKKTYSTFSLNWIMASAKCWFQFQKRRSSLWIYDWVMLFPQLDAVMYMYIC